MIASEDVLDDGLAMLGDSGLDDAELERRVARFQAAVRRLREDPAEATRIDVIAAGAVVQGGPGGGGLSVQRAGGPTILRILLGSQLRRLREAKGITRDEAGYAIRASGSKISRMELGRVSFRERDVVDLLGLYGVADEAEGDALVALARQASVPGWWQKYDDVLPDWFQAYLGLEEAASLIRLYEAQFVPELLQTVDYARAVVALGVPDAPEEEVERRVSLRIARQGMLSKAGGPRLWAVVDEAALRRPVGGREVIRAQLRHLIEVTAEPNLTLQILPLRSGGQAGGTFTIMRFPEAELPDVVYLQQLTSALYLNKHEDVESYTQVMERLQVKSESPERTIEILRSMHKEATQNL